MKEKKGNAKKIGNYAIFKELHIDSIGTNYRVAEVEEASNKPIKHALLTDVHPFLFVTPEEWNRTNVLCQRIHEFGTPNLYTPEKIFKDNTNTYFVFPFIEGKTLAQIVDDASRKKKPIPFNLAFSISIAIASLIEVGSSITQKEQNFFHGFLTPDHIIFDYEGNIYLKCFGLWTLLDQNETAVSEMIRMYAAWLTPEFIRREPVSPRSDFYHLGYIVYRMLTGNYFSYLPGEDFQSTFTSISFVSVLPSTDIGFLTNLIDFFKKTLNPDINKRFSNIKEFKNYVSQYVRVEDISDFKTNLSDYIKELYSDAIEVEKQDLIDELSRPIIENNAGDFEKNDLMEHIPVALEEKKRSKLLVFLVAAIVVVIAAVAGFFVIDLINKANKKQLEAAKLMEQQSQRIQEFQQKLSTLEVREKLENTTPQTVTQPVVKVEEKKEKKEIIGKIKDNKSAGVDQTKPQVTPKSAVDTPKETPKETTSLAVTAVKPAESTIKKDTPTQKEEVRAPLVTLNEVTVKPKQISGKDPEFPASMRKSYAGRRATVRADLLIDENGNVAQIDLLDKSEIPADVQIVIKDTLKQWKFKPAQKGDIKVKVKWPVKLKIFFQADL